jgi:geranylgeranyl pyrophosphate synthase
MSEGELLQIEKHEDLISQRYLLRNIRKDGDLIAACCALGANLLLKMRTRLRICVNLGTHNGFSNQR